MRSAAWLSVLAASVTACAGADGGSTQESVSALQGQDLEVHQINVGWGSSVLIIGPDGTKVLLEAGNTGDGTNRVVPYLQSLGILPANGLDYTIAGHQHCDHIGGMDEVVNAGYDVHTRNYYNGSSYSSSCATEWSAAAATTTGGALVVPTPGEQILLGNGARLTFVAVDGHIIGGGTVAVSDENDRSIAVLVQYGGFDYLWASDLGGGSDTACTGRSTTQSDVETAVVQAISPGGAAPLISAGGIDLLHVNHHGSESSTNMSWMNYAAPAVALIGTGAGQSSGWDLPRIDVVDNVLLAQAPCITAPPALVLQTEEGQPAGSLTSFSGYSVGDIKVTTNGQSTFTVSADGNVTEGPNEVAQAGLPRTFALDDVTAPPDTQAPTTSITAPANGATVSGVVAVSADASDDVGVARTELWIDGAQLAVDNTAPYGWSWDTTAVANGDHVLRTDAYDFAGNLGSSTPVTVTVSNSSSSPAVVILNEILANEPGSDTAGEFVELVNAGGTAIDIGGWKIFDSVSARHVFAAGTTLQPGMAVVVFAGASAIPPGLSNAVAASSGALALNNGGDTVRLENAAGVTIDSFTYPAALGGTDGVSMNRNPDGSPTGTFVLHTTISALASSPGKRATGAPFPACSSDTQCSDGNVCNGAETCQAGTCVAGTPPSCDDGNACTTDSCDAIAGCSHGAVANGSPCTDGDACTSGDSCQGGTCTAGGALSCDDGNPCTDDGCDSVTGCTHANNSATCDDGNACTSGDQCVAGTCTPGGNTCGPSVIASDGFEGNFGGGGGWAESSWRVSGDAVIRTNVDGPHSGSKHARLRQGSGSLKRKVNLSGRTAPRLQLWAKVNSFEGNDRAYVKISVNGGAYTIVQTFAPAQSNNVYGLYDLDLAACSGIASCEIYFDAAMSGTDDQLYLDDIQVTAF